MAGDLPLTVAGGVQGWRRVALAAVASALLVAASQAQWWLGETAGLLSLTNDQLRLIIAVVAAVILLAVTGSTVARFPVPSPPRPAYPKLAVIGFTGWGLVGLFLIAPGMAIAVHYLFDVADRDGCGDEQSLFGVFVNDVAAPALWEELLWRVVILAVLMSLTGPRTAVLLQAISFAVAHTSLSVGFGQVSHEVCAEYLVDAALGVALSGVVFGVLVVELGTVWPAVVAHAATNAAVEYRDTIPWLSYLLVMISTSTAGAVLASRATRRMLRQRSVAWLHRD